MDILKLVLDGCRRGLLAALALLRTIPGVWLVVMGVVAVPIAILSALVAMVLFILLVLVAILWIVFYMAVWRPVFRAVRKKDRVIEAEYTVKKDSDP